MSALINTLKRIVGDLAAGRNWDSYALVLAAFALAVLSLIEDSLSTDVKFAVILAALGLLVYKTTLPEKRPLDLDTVLQDRQGYGSFRSFIKGGRVMWVYGASAVNVLRNAAEIKQEILDRGGEVRFLLQDPDNEASMGILRQQLDQVHNLDDDIRTSLSALKNMASWKTSGKLEYALVDYSPGFSITIIDPDGKDGRLVIEFYGYRNDFITERMHIEIARNMSHYWFEYWARQFDVMWQHAHKGEPVA